MRMPRGFTMIEMLISLGIFAVITGVVMANFRVGSQGDELRSASQLVASSIRRVQTSAIAGQTARFCRDSEGHDGRVCAGDGDCGGGACVNDVPRGGYGLHFDTTEPNDRFMVTFADTNADGRFQAEEEVRRDNVSVNIYVNVISVAPAALGSVLDIVFVPPRPSVRFNGGATSDLVAVIVLQHRSTMLTKTVSVNSISGRISAD